MANNTKTKERKPPLNVATRYLLLWFICGYNFFLKFSLVIPFARGFWLVRPRRGSPAPFLFVARIVIGNQTRRIHPCPACSPTPLAYWFLLPHKLTFSDRPMRGLNRFRIPSSSSRFCVRFEPLRRQTKYVP
jgi:hypothetical protein